MNRRQRIAAQVGGGLLLLALVFPPMFRPVSEVTKPSFLYGGSEVQKTYGVLGQEYLTTYHYQVTWTVLWLELAIIAVITGLVFVSVKDKE